MKHVLEIRYQLSSVRSMEKLRIRTIFDLDKVYLDERGSGKLLPTGSYINNLYALDVMEDPKNGEKALRANLDLRYQR